MATKASRIALAGSNISSTGEVDADTLDNLDNVDFARTSGVSTSFISDSYNILEVRTDNNDDQTSTDGIFKITNGSAGTTKAEFRWDESEDLVHTSYGDHGRHISIASNGNVGIGTGSTQPATKLDVAGTVTANQYNTDAALPTVRPSLLLDFANSKTLDPRITFARAGVGTYYDGKSTAKAEENILINSEAFGSWPTFGSNGTLTSGFTSPTGTSTAWRLQYPQGTGGTYLQQTYSTKVGSSYTMSVYAKENASGSQFTLRTDGSVISSAFSTSSSWQRYSFTFTATLTTHMIEIDNTSTAATDILIWGAQVEENSSATTYIATTSSPIVKYQPKLQTAGSGTPRFDHDPITGESKGLLIEEARTNIITSSTNMLSSIWGSSGTYTNIIANSVISPSGDSDADSILETTDNNSHRHLTDPPITGLSGTTATYSVFVKPVGPNTRHIFFMSQSGADGFYAHFNMSNGTVHQDITGNGTGTGTAAGIVSVGNGWYRIWITGSISASSIYHQLYFETTTRNGFTAESYTGDGASGFAVWGYQVEAGAFPTSYIHTTGSAVTRGGERVSMPLSGVYNNGPLTIYTEAAEAGDIDYARLVLLSDNTNYNRMQIVISESSGNVQAYVETRDVVQTSLNRAFDPAYKTFFKVAAAYDKDNVAITAGGLTVATDTTVSTPEVTTLWLGSLNNSDPDSGATFKKVALYTQRLSNATLQAMTEE